MQRLSTSAETPALSAPSNPQGVTGEAERLVEAFRIFSQASDELSHVYSDLQNQVARLTEELAIANGALMQQYQEKAALTERLSLLLDALPAGVVVLDESGSAVQINPAAGRLLADVKVGSGWTAIEDSALQVSDTPGEYLSDGRRLAIAVTPLDSAGGRIVLLHDITEAQQLKNQAERHQRLAAMGEMAAQLAHQLRTPLAAALLYAGNLENPSLPADAQSALVHKTVGRLRHIERLIQDMLLFTRGEASGREPIPATDLLAELAQDFEPLAQHDEVHFVVTDGGAGKGLRGQRKSLVSAFTSLLENALQAVAGCADRRIMLSVRHETDSLLFTVEDTGCGMDEVTSSRLFDPFYTTRSDGTGLGLAIARSVFCAHGGSIDVVSSPGKGARFLVKLPCPGH